MNVAAMEADEQARKKRCDVTLQKRFFRRSKVLTGALQGTLIESEIDEFFEIKK